MFDMARVLYIHYLVEFLLVILVFILQNGNYAFILRHFYLVLLHTAYAIKYF